MSGRRRRLNLPSINGTVPDVSRTTTTTTAIATSRRVAGAGGVHLVGHDWGSLQGWEAVTTDHMAGRIASFTSMSGPCLDHAGWWIRDRLSSLRPSAIRQLAVQVERLVTTVEVVPVLASLWVSGTAFLLRHDPTRPGRPMVAAFRRAGPEGLLPTFGELLRMVPRYLRPSYHPLQDGSTSEAVAYLARSPAARTTPTAQVTEPDAWRAATEAAEAVEGNQADG